MSTRLSLQDLGVVDLVPQAMVKVSRGAMIHDMGVALDRGRDDLDDYSAAFFTASGQVFAFIRYDGEPADTISVYLERRLSPTDVCDALVRIADEFAIPADRIVWRETADMRLHAR